MEGHRRSAHRADADTGQRPAMGQRLEGGREKHYRHSASYVAQGSVMSYRDRYLDLDPPYKDSHGLPLLRMTFDWHDNEYKMAAYSAARLEEIVKTMKADSFATEMFKPGMHYDTRIYQSTHTTGGAIMGSNPSNSVINRYSQSCDGGAWSLRRMSHPARRGSSGEGSEWPGRRRVFARRPG
jgi:gluconate 2-dehydrogenase alpha chain